MPHYYLGSYVGVGSDDDPFRPRGSEPPGWSAIDLRPDSTDPAGRGLVAVPVRDDAALGDYLGQNLDEALPAPILRQVSNALSLTLSERHIRGIIAELLMVHGRTDGSRWRPLRPTRQGFYEIWLGGLLSRVPVLAGGASYSENWNCDDAASLTCQLTWTEFTGSLWEIASQIAQVPSASGTNAAAARAEHALDTDDHYAQATLAAFTRVSGTLQTAPLVRKDATATATYYTFQAYDDGTPQHVLAKTISGSPTILATVTDDPVVGEVLRVQADGSTISGRIDGVEKASVTDTAIAGNLYAGVFYRSTAIGNTAGLDNWSAADLAAAVTGHGGLHHIWHGIGDPGVAVVPQTLHTIEQGIAA